MYDLCAYVLYRTRTVARICGKTNESQCNGKGGSFCQYSYSAASESGSGSGGSGSGTQLVYHHVVGYWDNTAKWSTVPGDLIVKFGTS